MLSNVKIKKVMMNVKQENMLTLWIYNVDVCLFPSDRVRKRNFASPRNNWTVSIQWGLTILNVSRNVRDWTLLATMNLKLIQNWIDLFNLILIQNWANIFLSFLLCTTDIKELTNSQQNLKVRKRKDNNFHTKTFIWQSFNLHPNYITLKSSLIPQSWKR